MFDSKRGNDWLMYTEGMEQYFTANTIESKSKKRAVLLMFIGPNAYGLLWNLLAPRKPLDTEYAAQIKTMKDHAHLSPKPIIIAEW